MTVAETYSYIVKLYSEYPGLIARDQLSFYNHQRQSKTVIRS